MKKQQLYRCGDIVRLKSGKLAVVRRLLDGVALFFYEVRFDGGGSDVISQAALTPA